MLREASAVQFEDRADVPELKMDDKKSDARSLPQPLTSAVAPVRTDT